VKHPFLPITRAAIRRSTALGATAVLAASLAGIVPDHATAAAATLASARLASPPAGSIGSLADSAGSLTGLVRGAGRQGLAGACVVATGPGGARFTETTVGGRYALTGLRPGRYTLKYSDCRHPDSYFDQYYGGSTTPAGATTVLVTPGSPTSLRPVTLAATSPMTIVRATRARLHRLAAADARRGSSPEVSGVVRSASGHPLAGICAWAISGTPENGGGIGIGTSRNGSYHFPAGLLGRGKVRVVFTNGCRSHANYAPQWWKYVTSYRKATVLHLTSKSKYTGIDGKLGVGGMITGTIRGGSNHGPRLSNVCVLTQGQQASAVPLFPSQGSSGKDGSYSVTGLATGTYSLYFQPCGGNSRGYLSETRPDPITVKAGHTTRLNIVLSRASSISGTVTNTGKAPVAGICVIAEGAGADSESPTNANGQYTVGGLPAGHYLVEFTGGCGNKGSYAPQFYNDQQIVPTSVTVGSGKKVTGINATMQPGATITGKVTNQSGAALAKICVSATTPQLYAGAGETFVGLVLNSLLLYPAIAAARSGPTGEYRIANLSPGQYGISFTGCTRANRGYASQWFPKPAGGPVWVSVAAAQVAAASIKLLAAGSISGMIKSAAGVPLRGICSVPIGLAGQVGHSSLQLIAGGLGGGSNRHGDYLISGLAPGQYKVEFTPCNGQGYATTWYKHAGDQRAATTFTITRGRAITGIDPVMSPGQQVAGQVSSAVTKRPVGNECAAVLDTTENLQRIALTNGSGKFVFRHLLPGHYELAFFSCLRSSVLASEQVPITVTSAKPVSADLTLPRAGMVTGTVNGGDPALPVPGICAEAIPATGLGLSGIARTGTAGHYQITGLAPGQYQIQFTGNCLVGVGGFAPQWFNGQPAKATASLVRVAAGAVAAGVGATLAADGGIAGTVKVSGTPTAGVCVLAFRAVGGAPVLGETSATGSYQINGLVPGRYLVEFKSGCGVSSYRTQWYNGANLPATATPVRVQAGAITSAIDAH
jgi:Carboxypeptidase regulatory-like domain